MHWTASTEKDTSKTTSEKRLRDSAGAMMLCSYFHKVGAAPFTGVCSTDILVLAPKSPEWFTLSHGHTSSAKLLQFADLVSTGTTMPRVNWDDISPFKVALPPKSIAATFTRIIQSTLPRIHQHPSSRTLRHALLPKLLSAELRVASSL